MVIDQRSVYIGSVNYRLADFGGVEGGKAYSSVWQGHHIRPEGLTRHITRASHDYIASLLVLH